MTVSALLNHIHLVHVEQLIVVDELLELLFADHVLRALHLSIKVILIGEAIVEVIPLPAVVITLWNIVVVLRANFI